MSSTTDEVPGGDAALRSDAVAAPAPAANADAVAAENARVAAAPADAGSATPTDAAVIPLQAVKAVIPKTITLFKLEYRSAHDVIVIHDQDDLGAPLPNELKFGTTDVQPLAPADG